jgi:hypothetical protein
VRGRVAVVAVVGALGLVLATGVAVASLVAAAQGEQPEIESLTPPAGPVGTTVAYALAGTDQAGADQCSLSSAYRLELLAADGTLAATGGEAVTVPTGVSPGKATVRLVCYIPDATSRRVIHGLCARFEVTDGSAPPPASGSVAVDCPATPRVTVGQSVIAVERSFSEAFNPQLYYPLSR